MRGRPLWSDLEDDVSETAVDIFIESWEFELGI